MKKNRILAGTLTALLVASLAMPALAQAVPSQAKGNGPGVKSKAVKPATKAQRKAQVLQSRIERTLAQRKRKFDAAEARLQKRIDRLTALASKAASAGADVTTATTALDLAKVKLEAAAVEEAKAVDLFKAVPAAADRKAAFAAARAQAKVAQKSLQAARLQIVRAMQAIRKALQAIAPTTPEP